MPGQSDITGMTGWRWVRAVFWKWRAYYAVWAVLTVAYILFRVFGRG